MGRNFWSNKCVRHPFAYDVQLLEGADNNLASSTLVRFSKNLWTLPGD